MYVDDILMICNSMLVLTRVKRDLIKNFDMKDLGNARKILGVTITRDRLHKKMFLSSSDYILKLLSRFSMHDSKHVSVPLGGHLELTKKQCSKTQEEVKRMSNIPFDVVVGSVIYEVICTRPDLAFSISILTRFMCNPGEAH